MFWFGYYKFRILVMVSLQGMNVSLRNVPKSRVCVCVRTCGGGRPPAPSGHTGSMVSFFGVLHWQSGDGLMEFHSGLASLSIRTGLTRGISHSVVMLLHGKSLPVGDKEHLNEIKKWKSQKKNWSKFVKVAHSSGSSTMQRVPKPGLSNSTSPKYLIWASIGRSLLRRTRKENRHCYVWFSIWISIFLFFFGHQFSPVLYWSH